MIKFKFNEFVKKLSFSGLGAVLLLSLFELRVLDYIYFNSLGYFARISQDVLHGVVFVRAFQSRILGPGIIELIRVITKGSPHNTYFAFLFLAIISLNIIIYFIFRDIFKNESSALKNVIFSVLGFILLLDYNFIYTWDIISLSIFFIFSYGILKGKKSMFYMLLFVPAILNKEDAVFIPIWLMIDSFSIKEANFLKITIADIKKFSFGAVMTAAGLTYTAYIRMKFWHGANAALSGNGFGNQFKLFENLNSFYSNFSNPNVIISLLIIFLLFLFNGFTNEKNLKSMKTTALIYLVFLSILFFGSINETRAWFILLPLLLLLKNKEIKPQYE